MLAKTFLPLAIAGDVQAVMAYAKIAESTRVMLGLGAPRDAHPVLEQVAEPERRTGVDRIALVIERLCATSPTDPDAPVESE